MSDRNFEFFNQEDNDVTRTIDLPRNHQTFNQIQWRGRERAGVFVQMEYHQPIGNFTYSVGEGT